VPIPEFEDNVLPEGIHDCTFEELDEHFGRFQRSDRRINLTKKLKQYLAEARQSGVAKAVIVDGSYATAVEEPSDIDLILVLRTDFDLAAGVTPREYNVQSRRMVRRIYKFDVFAAPEGSVAYKKYLSWFTRVNESKPKPPTAKLRKGVIRITL